MYLFTIIGSIDDWHMSSPDFGVALSTHFQGVWSTNPS